MVGDLHRLNIVGSLSLNLHANGWSLLLFTATLRT